MVSFLASHDGPHSAEQWAGITAQTIFQVDPALSGARLNEALKTSKDIHETIVDHYADLQNAERASLAADPSHSSNPLIARVGTAAKDLVEALSWSAVQTPWEDMLHSVGWVEAALREVTNHMLTILHIERLWHADKHPENQAAQSYKRGNI